MQQFSGIDDLSFALRAKLCKRAKNHGTQSKNGRNFIFAARFVKKIALVMQKQEQLRQKVDELEKEIKLEKAQLQTESYLKAIRNPRIEFNLKLIQLLFGYITGLTDKISHFQNGYETLDFFQQQAQDDLLMIKTLNDMEIDELIAQINSVLDEFIPELDKPVFDTNDIPSKDTEKIWNEIIQPQKAKG